MVVRRPLRFSAGLALASCVLFGSGSSAVVAPSAASVLPSDPPAPVGAAAHALEAPGLSGAQGHQPGFRPDGRKTGEDPRPLLVLTALGRPDDRLELRPYDEQGNLRAEAHDAISRFLRCRETGRVKRIHPGTIALLYQIAIEHPGRELIVVSGYRARDKRSSPHRQARAVDLRVRGVSPARLSRELWKTYDGIAVGYYPKSGFVHVDVRATPIRWIERDGVNRYQAHARAERQKLKPVPQAFPLPSEQPTLMASAAPR